jgi:hypothetical protein
MRALREVFGDVGVFCFWEVYKLKRVIRTARPVK